MDSSTMKSGVTKSSVEAPHIARRALAMAFGTLSSRILGLAREMVFAACFDRSLTDAWTAAFRLPNLLRRLLGEGSLSVSLIPVFVEAHQEDRLKAQNLVNSLYSFLLVVTATLTVLGVLFTEPLLHVLLSPAFSAVPGKWELAVHMARIMFGFVFLITQYAFFMGILNALGSFALPALAPTFFNVSMITATLLSWREWVAPRDGLAWGVIAGGCLQAGILIPSLVRKGFWPRWQWSLQSPEVRQILRNMGPGLIGAGILQLMTLVNLRFASSLPQGSVSYVYWADRLLELPLSLVAVSVGSALLPELSRLASRRQRDHMSATTNFYLRLTLFVALPGAVGLFMLAQPIVEVLFFRGQFTALDVENTAGVLRVDAVLLIFLSCIRVLVPSFYALKNTWLPAVLSALSLGLHCLMAPWLMRSWGLQGLVISTCLSAAANLVMLAIAYGRWVGKISAAKLAKACAKFVILSAVMCGVLMSYQSLHERLGSAGLSLAVVIFAAVLSYGILALLLRCEELEILKKRFEKHPN